MDKKIKIALLLTGSLRNFEDTFESFKHFLLDKFDVDVFFYGVENKFGKKANDKFIELFKPIKYSINNKEYYNNILDMNISITEKNYIKSSYYSFYNVYMCNQLRKQYEIDKNISYDVVIRCRLDVFWFRTINEQEIESSKEMILTPKEWSFVMFINI